MQRRTVLTGLAGAAGLGLCGPSLAAVQRKATSEFVWGVAASAGQTESRDGRGRTNWDVFADTPGKIADGSSNARGTEFDKRYLEDLDLLAAADVPAFRLSTAWARVQPDGPGRPNQAGLDHYDRLFDAMAARGIQPWVTLFHWDVPVWAGDFRQRDIAARLADYAEIMVDRFHDRVKRWIVFNEPNSVAMAGYGAGLHAPGLRSAEAMLAAIHHQNLAIGLMMRAARAHAGSDALVGTTHNVATITPASDAPADVAAAARFDAIWNRAFLDPLFGQGYPAGLAKPLTPLIQPGDMDVIGGADPDFLGVNYYCRIPIEASPEPPGFRFAAFPERLEKTAYFPVEPDGLTEALLSIPKRYHDLPLYITETGFALSGATAEDLIQDADRTRHIEAYLAAAAKARDAGADLRGLFYWSSSDNWEWAHGFTKQFGLIAVDPVTQQRRPKRSLGLLKGQVEKHLGPVRQAKAG